MEERRLITDMAVLKEQMAIAAQKSQTYSKLAKYIFENYMTMIFMTAVDVAQAVGISQGSVTRFCNTLGYRGYNDFLGDLQKIVSSHLTAPQRLHYTSSVKNLQNRDILSMEHKNIDNIVTVMDSRIYRTMVENFVSAKEIVLLSARMSATILPYMYYILNKIRDNVFLVTPDTVLWETLILKNPSDVHIFTVSFPRYSNILLQKLSELKKAGFKISAITDNFLSPISEITTQLLEVPITRFSIFDVYSTPLLFVNLLLRDVAKKLPDLEKRLDRIEEIEHEKEVYYGNNKILHKEDQLR